MLKIKWYDNQSNNLEIIIKNVTINLPIVHTETKVSLKIHIT